LKKDKNDFFKSFAKPKTAPKEAQTEPPPAAIEDGELQHFPNGNQLTDIVATMQGMSEDEGEDDEGPEVKFDEEKAAQLRKARTDREAELKRMMEESGKLLMVRFMQSVSNVAQTKRCPTSLPRQRKIRKNWQRRNQLNLLRAKHPSLSSKEDAGGA
jgi:hypothetical protein